MYKVVYNACYGGFNLSNYAKLWMEKEGYDDDIYSIQRHHPLLIRCVETLGKEANGDRSNLIIKELKDHRYYIQQDDGYEKVITPFDEYYWSDARKLD